MEELDLKDLLNYCKRKLDVVFLTVILALLIGYTYIEYVQVPMYQGITTIILVEKNDNRVSDLVTQNEITVNEKLVTTYSEVIKSKRVLNRVITDLELETSIEDLIEAIQVSSVQDTAIIALVVENEDGEQAAIIANKIAEVFKEEITQIYNLENVSIIDEAVEEDEPYNVNIPLQFIVYAIIGGIISVAIIFVMYYFNNSISNKQEIESKLNIPVIGEVPATTILSTKNKKEKTKKKKVKKEKIQTTLEQKELTKENKMTEKISAINQEEDKPKSKKVTKKTATKKEVKKTTSEDTKVKKEQKKTIKPRTKKVKDGE